MNALAQALAAILLLTFGLALGAARISLALLVEKMPERKKV